MWQNFYCARSVQEVSSHFKYLENRSHGLDVTWQPVRGDRTAHLRTLSHGTSQSAVRRCWLSLCTVWPSHSQISFLSTLILALGKARSHREPNLGCRGTDRPERCDVFPKKPARELRNGKAHCHDKATSHHLPITAAVFFLPCPSADKGLDVELLGYCLAWCVLMVDNNFI